MMYPYLPIDICQVGDELPYATIAAMLPSEPDPVDCTVLVLSPEISPEVEESLRHVGLQIHYEFDAAP